MRDLLNLDEIFYKKAVMLRAWTAAKDAVPSRRKDNLGGDFVEKNEFRILLQYLRQYLEFYEAFDRVDSNDDRRISLSEFISALPVIEKWVGKLDNPE